MQRLKLQSMKLLFILSLIVFYFGCQESADGTFSVTVKHYAAAAGITKVYKITTHEISLKRDCDFQGCETIEIYKRPLEKTESDSVYRFLMKSGINDLKSKYVNDDVMDGFQSDISYTVSGLGSNHIQITNVEVPVAERLYREIDKHIDSINFRFHRDY